MFHLTEKLGSWFLLAKCHSSIDVFSKHFSSKNQVPDFYISRALVKNGLNKILNKFNRKKLA